jgi:hypothetical protein
MSRVTDAQIRELLRADPRLLDTAMVALHSADRELRRLARGMFAGIHESRRRFRRRPGGNTRGARRVAGR